MSVGKYIFFLFILLFATVGSSCLKSKKPGIPPEVLQVLNNSGIYKPDLLKIILAYQKPEDSIKLKSAYFLIKNLESNYYINISLRDSNNKNVVINYNDFVDYIAVKKQIDSIEIVYGKLNFGVDTILLDINNVSSDFFINHINNTVNYLNDSPWNSSYTLNSFFNFILPYRVANEKMASYTKHLHYKYLPIISNVVDISTASILLNNYINEEIKYDNRLETVSNMQSVGMIETTCVGNWRDINVYKIKALRSMGIAAVLDYTPYFSDSILGYYSTTVILPDGSELVLANADSKSVQYPQGKTAKVYRRVFNNMPSSLFSLKDKKTHTPPFLGDYNYLDVTSKYLQTDSVSIDFADTAQYVYLAVYNENSWKPIDWSVVQADGKATFYNMGTGVTYMPVIVSEDSIISVGESFVLDVK